MGWTKVLRNTDFSFDNAPTAGGEETDVVDESELGTINDDGDSVIISDEKVVNKRKKPDVERALINFMESHRPAEKPIVHDEDMVFFYSLLPFVRLLDMDQKFTFRMQTMQLLHHIRNQLPTNQPMQSHSLMNTPTPIYCSI